MWVVILDAPHSCPTLSQRFSHWFRVVLPKMTTDQKKNPTQFVIIYYLYSVIYNQNCLSLHSNPEPEHATVEGKTPCCWELTFRDISYNVLRLEKRRCVCLCLCLSGGWHWDPGCWTSCMPVCPHHAHVNSRRSTGCVMSLFTTRGQWTQSSAMLSKQTFLPWEQRQQMLCVCMCTRIRVSVGCLCALAHVYVKRGEV